MPVQLSGLEEGRSRPVAVTSVLVELGCALHALHDPDHHRRTDWAADIRAAMGPGLVEETAAWAWATRAIRAAPFVTVSDASEDFAAQLDRIYDDPQRTARGLLRPISLSGDPQTAVRWARARGVAVSSRVQALVHEPEKAVRDFGEFLQRSWDAWFGAEWNRVRATLAARARRFSDQVDRHGVVPAVVGLDSSITASKSGTSVAIAKVQSSRHDVGRRGLIAVPSCFIHPHLYVADVPRQPLLLIHPAAVDESARAPGAAELLRRLDVAANPGRLEVARAIATEPRTAGEIAGLWNIDATLVNRHLRALASAGLARTHRRGRFQAYALDVDAIESMGTDLVALLLR